MPSCRERGLIGIPREARGRAKGAMVTAMQLKETKP